MKCLHPLSLLIFALWLSSMAIVLGRLDQLCIVMLLSLLAKGILTGFGRFTWMKQIVRTLPLFLAILVIQILFVKDGELLFGYDWFAVHERAVTIATAFYLRLLILLFTAQMLLKLDYEDFDHAFTALNLPEELCFMVFYALHIIPLLGARIKHFRQLLVTRGIDIRKVALHNRLWIYKTLSLTLIADLLTRSAWQAMALDLRGFRTPGKHTRLLQRSFSAWDAQPILTIFGASILFIIT